METQRSFIWGASGSGLSEYAWQISEDTQVAWVGNDAAAHITLLRATVEEELAFGMEQRGVPREVMLARIREAAAQWGLEPLLRRDPASLSTGQTRRVAIASALLARPEGLVLDCPLDGCDAQAADTLIQVIEGFPGQVTICDRRWNALAQSGANYRFANGALERAEAPRAQLPKGAYKPLLTATHGGSNDVVLQEASIERKDPRGQQRFGIGPLTLRFPAGRITHLRGVNGCGKTTLMLAIGGLIPSRGHINAPAIGWMPTAMDQSFSQRSALLEAALGSDEEHAQEALEWCGLAELAHKHPLDLNSTQRRLLAFACAIVRGPGALLLDEPTIGLDTEGIERFARLIREFVQGNWHARLASRGLSALEQGAPTVIWSCHEVDFAGISDFVLDL
ncbi:ATP-binding cassette domain-containing protein [Corynebacterium gerontici]|uniref:HMP/thiamine import ATP-binding protein YkoD n=1 Tax=Corynebacterium gerontici TaxID=2079234 RepID=A0A3G6J292_9CORY|nr:ATP-binding cassette domain-containing protein [Corynebacterium gerontici]AZA12181.1 Putative HMP/thiamine import ATP-binding protein YkoD [Corynebacterium gerontici]